MVFLISRINPIFYFIGYKLYLNCVFIYLNVSSCILNKTFYLIIKALPPPFENLILKFKLLTLKLCNKKMQVLRTPAFYNSINVQPF
jgi:hypothetical protein